MIRADHAQCDRHARLAGDAARGDADRAPRGEHEVTWCPPLRRGGRCRISCEPSRSALVGFVGRRIGGRQRSDAGRPGRRRRRRAAEARQLHRVFGRRRGDVRDSRRSGVGRRSGFAEFARRKSTRAPYACWGFERGASARPRGPDAPRAGRRRRVRELALRCRTARHGRRRPPGPRARSKPWCVPPNGRGAPALPLGSIDISPVRRLHARRIGVSGASPTSCPSLELHRASPPPPSSARTPVIVLAGLLVCGGWALLETFGSARAESRRRRREWRPAALIASASSSMSLMDAAGFVVASAALFWLTARAFDPAHRPRSPVRDRVSTVAYLLFVHVLSLTLPCRSVRPLALRPYRARDSFISWTFCRRSPEGLRVRSRR